MGVFRLLPLLTLSHHMLRSAPCPTGVPRAVGPGFTGGAGAPRGARFPAAAAAATAAAAAAAATAAAAAAAAAATAARFSKRKLKSSRIPK